MPTTNASLSRPHTGTRAPHVELRAHNNRTLTKRTTVSPDTRTHGRGCRPTHTFVCIDHFDHNGHHRTAWRCTPPPWQPEDDARRSIHPWGRGRSSSTAPPEMDARRSAVRKASTTATAPHNPHASSPHLAQRFPRFIAPPRPERRADRGACPRPCSRCPTPMSTSDASICAPVHARGRKARRTRQAQHARRPGRRRRHRCRPPSSPPGLRSPPRRRGSGGGGGRVSGGWVAGGAW